MQYPLISLCIPCYNAEKTIKEALESAIKQDYPNLEIIVINDGSKDQSFKIIEKYAKKDPRIKVFSQKNQGQTQTRINCIKESKGWAICWLDADDFLTSPQAVSKLAKVLIENPKIGFVYSNFYCQKTGLTKIKNAQIKMPNHSNLQRFRSHHFKMFCRWAYNKTSGFNPKYIRAQDQDLAMKLEEVCQTKFVDEVLYFYRYNDTAHRKNIQEAQWAKKQIIKEAIERRKQLTMNN